MTNGNRITLDDALQTAIKALAACGASGAHAEATGRSIVAAEAEGNRSVGFAHLIDYCDALAAGRADGHAEPFIDRPKPGVIRIDARTGFPQLGVDRAIEDLIAASRENGIAVLSLKNGYTCGALGWYARRLADDHRLFALVAANAGPPVMPASGGKRPVFCTNPIAVAMPFADRDSIVIDQSATAGALVTIHQARAAGKTIPEGWALDSDGNPTTDPEAALAGSLLPFGGQRGANIALIVELMAAGLTGGNWSVDAPAFNKGSKSPGVGLTIVAIDVDATHGDGVAAHLRRFYDVLEAEKGVHIPGPRKRMNALAAKENGIEIDRDLWARVRALAGSG